MNKIKSDMRRKSMPDLMDDYSSTPNKLDSKVLKEVLSGNKYNKGLKMRLE